jgi:hypothetical protein
LFTSKIGTFCEIVGDYFVKKDKSSDFERILDEKECLLEMAAKKNEKVRCALKMLLDLYR